MDLTHEGLVQLVGSITVKSLLIGQVYKVAGLQFLDPASALTNLRATENKIVDSGSRLNMFSSSEDGQ